MALAKQENDNTRKKSTTSRTSTNNNTVVRDTTNASNLAGTNNIQNAGGRPKNVNTSSGPTGVNTNASNLAGTNNIRNAGGTVRNTTKVNNDAYTSNYSKPNTAYTSQSKYVAENQTKTNLRNNQSTLNQVADNSSRKASQIVNDVSNKISSFSNEIIRQGLENQQYYNQQRQERFEKSRENAYTKAEESRNQALVNTTDDDRAKFYNRDGSRVDFASQIEKLQGQKASLENIISTAENEGQRAGAQAELNDVDIQLNSLLDLQNKRDAFEEDYN